MKRFLSILLIFCFALTVGCAKTVEDTSSSVSEPHASSQESGVGDAVTTNPLVQKIDSVLSENQDRTLSSKNLLRGLSYSVSRETSQDYPDTDGLLTDGNLPVGFSEDQWAGYYSTVHQDLTVTFDLGSETEGILDFSARVLHMPEYGINICKKVIVSVAGEDGEYVSVGTALAPSDIGSNSQHDMAVLLQGSVTARYIRFEFSDVTSVWLFVGEVSAHAYGAEYESNVPEGNVSVKDYYGCEDVPFAEAPTHWSESEPDLDKNQNLIKDKKPLIFSSESLAPDVATDWYNTKNTALLTNGRFASVASYSDGNWFHFTRGADRELVFDLGNLSCITGFSVNLLRDSGVGVNLPRNFSLLLSENGRDWQTVYSQAAITADSENAIVTVKSDTAPIKARFAKFGFDVDVHTYIDEIQLMGTKKIPSDAKSVVPDSGNGGESSGVGEFASPEDFCGVNNMLLSYNCLTDMSNFSIESGLITKEEYLPYVAYLDEKGGIKDTFFDAFLYLPYTAFNYSDYGRSADGWRTYVDNIYTPDRNMDALDQCVELVGDALSIENYSVKVFTPVLYTFTTLGSGATNPFGDIDGDGANEDFSNIEHRKKAIKWIMDEEYNRFKNGGYSHLEFCGFYWFEEAIAYNDPHETELIRFASDYAHRLGVKLFWIPYQRASGYADWKELGFDLACMQPNYMFNDSFSADILYDNAETTKLYGMCVELEINDPTNKQDASRYTEYLIAGAQTGYMNAVKIYYQNGVPGAFHTACYSKDPGVRRIYDDTYLFAKERYVVQDVSDITLSDGDILHSCEMDGYAKGSFDTSDKGGYVTLAMSPRYGSVRIDLDGSYEYIAPNGFVGEDSFWAVLDFGYSKSVPTRVIISVG